MLTRSEHRHSNNNRILIATERCDKYCNYIKLHLGIFILVCRILKPNKESHLLINCAKHNSYNKVTLS